MSVHEILSAITEAKIALDREPQLTSRILELEQSLSQAQGHSQAMELKLIERNDTINNLQSKVRSLEVERDDMGFRELEARDLVEKALQFAQQSEASAVAITNLLKSPPQSITTAPDNAKNIPITESGSTVTGLSNTVPNEPELNAQKRLDSHSQTLSSEPTPEYVPQAVPPTSKPYAGKTYSQVFGDIECSIDYNGWVIGGGTIYGWQN
jgi:chromosome segregation ATPase